MRSRWLVAAALSFGLFDAAQAAPPAAPAPVVPVRGAPATFADLADRLLPTVVNIATTQTLKPAAGTPGLPNIPPGSPLADLFKDFLGQGPSLPRHVTSLGSGFIIDPSGYIVTNNHVIEGADQISVTLNDGRTLPAKLIGRDEKTDLALLKVNPPKPLPAAKFGDSDTARIGDWVIAIGNPFGLGSTVTAGIVSARNRDIESGPYDDFIQTDAPINRGNSGGPLFDMNGNVVGVNSAIYSPSGGSVGIAFSIPSDLVKEVTTQLRQFGQARRGWVGVRIQQVTEDIAEGLGLPGISGALIADVTPGGPAARGGIQNGDFILAFDGKVVGDSRALSRVVADTPINKNVAVLLFRKGQKLTVHVTVLRLNEKPTAPPPKAPPVKPGKVTLLGLSLGPLDGAARGQYHIPGNVQGVLVVDVAGDSPAFDKNIRAGDVILQVQGNAVHTPDEVSNSIAYARKVGKTIVALLVSRGGETNYVAIKLN
ncbi:MAG TPA: DegQ family serine endoprotease [Rhizomicrobium sp.]|jgi:serine protease Do|nr:DegQ family serine endoprotease [Rhizomicrobium sp.]